MAVGDFWELGERVRKELQDKLNRDATLINLQSVAGND